MIYLKIPLQVRLQRSFPMTSVLLAVPDSFVTSFGVSLAFLWEITRFFDADRAKFSRGEVLTACATGNIVPVPRGRGTSAGPSASPVRTAARNA